MSAYYRGNLAVEWEESSSASKKVKVRKIISTISTGEKLLYLSLVALVISCAAFVGMRYAEISEYSYQIQDVKQELKELKEENAQLRLNIEQKSNRDQIEAVATELGMKPATDVRVITLDRPAQELSAAKTP